MRIIIQDTAKEHNAERDALIRRKVRALSRNAPALKDAVVDVQHGRRHKKGENAYVEISLHLFCHGSIPLRAAESSYDIHAALDLCIEKIKRQLSTHKEKDRTLSRDEIRTMRGK